MLDPPVRRPGQSPAPRSARIEIRVTEAARKAIERQAAKEKRVFSDMVRILLQRGMDKS